MYMYTTEYEYVKIIRYRPYIHINNYTYTLFLCTNY